MSSPYFRKLLELEIGDCFVCWEEQNDTKASLWLVSGPPINRGNSIGAKRACISTHRSLIHFITCSRGVQIISPEEYMDREKSLEPVENELRLSAEYGRWSDFIHKRS